MSGQSFFLFRNRGRVFFLFAFLFSIPNIRVQAQDLKDELSALDDIPEDDLSDSASSAPAPSAKAEIPPEDDLNLESRDSLEKELESVQDSPPPAPKPSAPLEAMTGVSNESSARLTHIRFKQLSDRVRLILTADRGVDWTREMRARRKQVILELRNTSISGSLLKKVLDTGEFDGPVALIQAFDSRLGTLPSVKVLFQLRQFVEPTVIRSGNEVYVDFPILVDGSLFSDRSRGETLLPETFLSGTSKIPFKGSKISLNVKDADLSDVLNLLSKAAGRNFVLSGSNSAKVTLNVRNTPWDQALSVILLNAKLGYQKIGNTYRIAPIADLKAEIQESLDSAQKTEDLLPLESKLFALSYAKAADVANSVKDFASKRGKAVTDQRTNTIVVTDTPATIEKVARYIRSIDKQTPQVLIEARIVEASEDFVRDLNINWKLGEVSSGRLSDSFINVGKLGGTLTTPGTTRYSDVGSVASEQGGVRLKIGELGSLGAIQAVLGLAETENKAKIIASPRVTVLDNKEATIAQGTQVPVVTPATANAPATTTYVPAELRLEVTPQVTADGFVLLKTKLFRDNPKDANASSSPIESRRAETEMIVESGKTGVIGGIYTIEGSESELGWPYLRKVPLLGMLFQPNRSLKNTTRELIMFVSPRILNADRARFISEDGEGDVPMARGTGDGRGDGLPRDSI